MIEKINLPVYIGSNENKEYFDVKHEYMTLINQYREKIEDQFIGGMPVQLEKSCLNVLLKENNGRLVYGMKLKADGVRHLMFLSKSGIIYFIDRVTNIFYFKNDNTLIFNLNKNAFLFDGELIFHKSTGNWEFLIFDVLCYNGIYTLTFDYYNRLKIIHDVLQSDLKDFKGDFELSTKEWYSIETILLTDNIYKFIIKDTNEKRKNKPQLKDDGLILQPFDESYVPFREWNVYNNIQFKWKPPNQLTIDFKIKINTPNEWWLLTKSNQVFQIKQPDGQNVNAICLPTNKNKEEYVDGDIVEVGLKEKNNPQNNIFTILQKRTDKTEGNSYNTAMSVMEASKHKFTLDELKIPLLSLKNNTDLDKILNLYSKSELLLCVLNDTFFDVNEIQELKNIYKEYVLRITEKDIPVNITVNERISKILKSRDTIYPSVKSGKKKSNYELEFRVFPYVKKSLYRGDDEKKTIKKSMYFYLLSFLMKSGYPYVYDFSIDITLNEYNPNGKYRSTYKNIHLKNPHNEFKQKIKNYTLKPTTEEKLYNNLTFKLNLSNEIKTNKKIELKSQLHDRVVYNTTRIKKRFSFNIHKYWRLDLTRVITNYGKIDLSEQLETYEIECEYVGPVISEDKFINSMEYVYKLILNNSGYCFT